MRVAVEERHSSSLVVVMMQWQHGYITYSALFVCCFFFFFFFFLIYVLLFFVLVLLQPAALPSAILLSTTPLLYEAAEPIFPPGTASPLRRDPRSLAAAEESSLREHLRQHCFLRTRGAVLVAVAFLLKVGGAAKADQRQQEQRNCSGTGGDDERSALAVMHPLGGLLHQRGVRLRSEPHSRLRA